MPASLDDNRSARDAILARVRKALGKTGDRASAMAEAEGYIAAHRHGPRPTLPADLPGWFVKRATEGGNADEETLRTIHRVAFDEGAEAPLLKKSFGEIVFPQTEREKKEKLRGQIAAAARKLSALVAEDGSPVPRQMAIRVEETIGELLEAIEN